MIAKLINLFKKTEQTGTQVVTETLASFVDIIDKLYEGANKTTEEMDANANVITKLQEKQQALLRTNQKANVVRENLLKLMGE